MKSIKYNLISVERVSLLFLVYIQLGCIKYKAINYALTKYMARSLHLNQNKELDNIFN